MVTFHRLLIGTFIVFSAGFAVYGWRDYQRTHAAWSLVSAIAFGVFALAFVAYLALLRRFLGEK
jgi:TRAP-type C4-dicarboxylate transport system permease small subunit